MFVCTYVCVVGKILFVKLMYSPLSGEKQTSQLSEHYNMNDSYKHGLFPLLTKRKVLVVYLTLCY